MGCDSMDDVVVGRSNASVADVRVALTQLLWYLSGFGRSKPKMNISRSPAPAHMHLDVNEYPNV